MASRHAFLRSLTLVCLLGVSASCARDQAPATLDEHAHAPGEHGVGTVAFPTSCSAEAQPVFERGVAALHSFWFDEALTTFQEADRIDPSCAMAPWARR